MDHDEAAPQHTKRDDDEPSAEAGREAAELPAERKPIDFNGTTEDILRSIGRLPERDFAHAADNEYTGRVDLGGVR